MSEEQYTGGSVLKRFAPIVLFLMLAAAFLYGLRYLDPQAIPAAMVDKPVPDFTVPDLHDDASVLTADALRQGKPTVLNVFASWCPPCRAEHPMLESLAALGVAPVYGLAYKDDPDNTRDFLDELGDPFTQIGVDRNGRSGIEFGVAGVPETFVIDGEGRIVYKHFGPINPGDIEQRILPAIREASGQ